MVINLYEGSGLKAIKYISSKEVVTVQDTVCDYVIAKPLEPRSIVALSSTSYIYSNHSFPQEKISTPRMNFRPKVILHNFNLFY